ncbi:MAG: hypothetical protein RL293_2041 [Bacteroidota bacterium]
MKNAGRFSLFFGLLVMLTSSIQQSTPNISGLWSEHWIDSDVNYVDTLLLSQKNDSLLISLYNSQVDWEPNFLKVKFDGSLLTFQMDANNITNFFTFKLSDDQKRFEGKVHTWRGHIRKIYLEKEGR